MYNVGNLKYGSMYFEDEPDMLTSRYKIERINTMLKEKKAEIERLKYIINLYERERLNIVKEEVSYYWYSHSYIDKIRSWLEMSKTKYDKRKKYEEKEAYDFVSDVISSKIFLNKPIKIIDSLSGGYENYTDIIVFICEDMQFRLEVPHFKSMTVKNFQYANEGKLTITVKDSSCSCAVIASSYDEDEVIEQLKKFFDDEEKTKRIKEKTKDYIENA